jgi:hypothetical protein
MLRFLAGALLCGTLLIASGCGASRQHGSASTAHGGREHRAMTWHEYYCDAERRTKRAGGFVMWLNPPKPERIKTTDPKHPPDPECTGTLVTMMQ